MCCSAANCHFSFSLLFFFSSLNLNDLRDIYLLFVCYCPSFELILFFLTFFFGFLVFLLFKYFFSLSFVLTLTCTQIVHSKFLLLFCVIERWERSQAEIREMKHRKKNKKRSTVFGTKARPLFNRAIGRQLKQAAMKYVCRLTCVCAAMYEYVLFFFVVLFFFGAALPLAFYSYFFFYKCFLFYFVRPLAVCVLPLFGLFQFSEDRCTRCS